MTEMLLVLSATGFLVVAFLVMLLVFVLLLDSKVGSFMYKAERFIAKKAIPYMGIFSLVAFAFACINWIFEYGF